MLNKGLAYLGVHALYLMAIHNQPNLYGWLNKLSVKLCAGLPGWYMQGMFFLLLTVAALIIAMGLESRDWIRQCAPWFAAAPDREKRADKPGALLTFRSRFAMIPR